MNPNIDHTTAWPNDTAFNIEGNQPSIQLSQTSFGHISTNSSMILTVSMAMESPWKDLLIDTSHTSKQSVLAKILGRSTSNHYGTIY